MKNKLLYLSFILIAIFIVMPTTAFAADATISAGGSYEIDTLYGNNSSITISTADPVTLTQNDSSTALTNFQIVYSVGNANLEIAGLKIDNSLNDDKCPIAFVGTGNVLNVLGTNTFTAGINKPGVMVEGNLNSLTIRGNDSSALIAIGGTNSAGIGASGDGVNPNQSGTIIMESGNIVAQGGKYGAGIGGGYLGDNGTVTVGLTANVIASGNEGGAGIGGGFGGGGGSINIYSGTVNAFGGTDVSGHGGAGIGGGVGTFESGSYYGGNFTSINITGGSVTATGGTRAAGIGGGYHQLSTFIGAGGSITLGGGAITAISDRYTEPIGAGYTGRPASITIASGAITPADTSRTDGRVYDLDSYNHSTTLTITATDEVTLFQTDPTSPKLDFQIYYPSGGARLTLDGVTIHNGAFADKCALEFNVVNNILNVKGENILISGDNQPGIKVEGGISGDLIIQGENTSVLNVRGGMHSAGIGCGGDGITPSETGIIIIQSGSIIAQGGDYAAGIGGGHLSQNGTVQIEGDANITATGGEYGAGIGGGRESEIFEVKITDNAIVNATGGEYGSAIGSGMLGTVYKIGIYSSAHVTATSSGFGAGIGGGGGSDSGEITIGNTPTVIASGGTGAGGAGIGGGWILFDSSNNPYGGNCDSVRIYGRPQVTATGAYGAAGIGGGLGGNAFINDGSTDSVISISGGTVVATGGDEGAGIGGGARISHYGNYYGSKGADVTISGGEVYAEGLGGARDIGYGNRGTDSGKVLTINNTVVVFLRNGAYVAINTPTHKEFDDENITAGQAYGYTVPSLWTDGDTAYAWLVGYEVQYRSGSNGSFGVGDTEEIVIAGGSPDTPPQVIPDASYQFDGWSDSVITSDNLNDFTINADTTLTAQYSPVSVTGITLDKNNVTLDIGDTDTLVCTVNPSDALDKSVVWASDNTLVATVIPIDSASCTINANNVGVAYITVTTNDGSYTDTCKVTVWDSTVYDVDKYGGLSGTVLENDGTALENWYVTLYSTPVSITTDANGSFGYTGIQYSHHTLVFTDASGTEFDRYTLNFVSSANPGYRITGDVITINYTGRTSNVDLEFSMNVAGNEFELMDAVFTERAVNPRTKEETWWELVINWLSKLLD